MIIEKRRLPGKGSLVPFLLLIAAIVLPPALAQSWWSPAVEARLEQAGTNRTELTKALAEVSIPRRDGLVFLLENMPDRDLRSLSAAFLLEHLNLGYEAWEKAPWSSAVPRELFFNDVLPYTCLNEQRELWRAKLREVCAPIVQDCKRPGDAAHLLNQKLFPFLNVRYSTTRKRPDQSPSETMQSGVATCTGLSILLVDACRSVGIPARVVGTPMWSNLRGNHTWVEVWDGDWHFAGAAEPDGAGLDRGWFVQDASQAQRDVPKHAIYATSFRRSEVHFPLPWAREDTSVAAVNVTDRYAQNAPANVEAGPRLSVRVVETDGKRVVADLLLSDPADSALALKEKSRGETADLNDFATFKVRAGRPYHLVARMDDRMAQSDVLAPKSPGEVVTLTLPEKLAPPASLPVETRPEIKPLPERDATRLRQALLEYFTADASRQSTWRFPARLERLLRRNEPAVRETAWDVFKTAPIHRDLQADFDAGRVRSAGYQSPYTVKAVGRRPAAGWPLFIAMHGGGGAPKEVNDSQWKHMQVYYRDHPEVGGYLYVALRAPNDTWNGFYDDYVYPLIDQLIRQFRLCGDIDPDKVFIMGYSHGGYGAYAIGPKMPDHFAAIHASAAAATDGETTAKTLRSTPFTAMVGERDRMYGRYSRNLKFKEEIEQLRAGRTDIYPVTVTVVAGNGHTGLPDRDKIRDLYPAVRNPVPNEVSWLMTDGVVRDHFWLHVPHPGKQQEISARCEDNRFVISANEKVSGATVWMDARLVDFGKPVTVELNAARIKRRFAPSLERLCENLVRRADPGFAYTANFSFSRTKSGQLQLSPPSR